MDLHRNGDESVGSQESAAPADGAAQPEGSPVPAVGTPIQERSTGQRAPQTRPQVQPTTQLIPQPNTPRCQRGKCVLPPVVSASSDQLYETCPECRWTYRLHRTVMMWFVA